MPFPVYLSLSVWCVCVCFIIFEKKIHCGKWVLDISELFIQCNKDSCYEHITVVVIYLYVWSVYWPLSVLHVFVCLCLWVFVWDQIRVPAKSEYQELNLLPNFQKKKGGGGAWQDLNFQKGVAGKEGVIFLGGGGLQLLQKKKTKIWNI